MGRIKKFVIGLLLAHLNALKSQLDIVREKPASSSLINRHFLLPLLISAFTPIYGTLALEYEAVGRIEWRSLVTSPYPYSHQIGAASFINQLDFAFLCDFICCVCIYSCLSFAPNNFEDNYRPYRSDNGLNLMIGKKVLNRAESNQMSVFGSRVKMSVYCILGCFYFVGLSYFMSCLWINKAYTLSIQSVVFWLLVFPLYWFYLVFAIYASIVVVIMLSKLVQIQQQTILNQLYENNRNFGQRKHANVYLTGYYWRKHLAINRSVLDICGQIRAYSRYCSPLLTVIIPFYICLQCYLMYIVFIDQTTAFIEKQHYFYAVIEVELFLFAITYHCAKVVKTNQRIVSENRKFCITMMTMTFGKNYSFWKSQLLKAEFLQTPRLLHKYAFRLETVCYRITMNTFHVLISYIGVFFLLLIKSQRKQIKITGNFN